MEDLYLIHSHQCLIRRKLNLKLSKAFLQNNQAFFQTSNILHIDFTL